MAFGDGMLVGVKDMMLVEEKLLGTMVVGRISLSNDAKDHIDASNVKMEEINNKEDDAWPVETDASMDVGIEDGRADVGMTARTKEGLLI
ncbi:hypothetical protein VNO77_16968 [Canavalia gladiata]|uniref:Uncharacterized protein n=1 Tax=Canavalia gladiata TaxID=3824 RepID=A0AAN9LLV2_CANGL